MDFQSLRYLNKKKVLHYIQENQGQSRSDISKALNISKPTISNVVDELLSENWIHEKESETASPVGGRKPYHIYFNHNVYHLIGVDIGGTSVELALMNLAGEIKQKDSFPTQVNKGKIVESIVHKAHQLMEKSNLAIKEILGMGVGVPGITDVERGIVIDAPSIDWNHVPLKQQLEELLHFPVYIDNDVNVAALGEQWKGQGKTSNNILMITLGTGIGCGIIINRKLYRGSSFAAGEIGYMVTDKTAAEKNYEHTFAGYGFLDSHVGGPSISRRMQKQDRNTDDKDFPEWTAKKVFQEAINGNEKALKTVQNSFSHLAFALINVISIMNPEKIILGGGISKSIQYFLPQLRATIKKHIPIKTEIVVTTLENVSVIGAGYLLLKEYDSILKD